MESRCLSVAHILPLLLFALIAYTIHAYLYVCVSVCACTWFDSVLCGFCRRFAALLIELTTWCCAARCAKMTITLKNTQNALLHSRLNEDGQSGWKAMLLAPVAGALKIENIDFVATIERFDLCAHTNAALFEQIASVWVSRTFFRLENVKFGQSASYRLHAFSILRFSDLSFISVRNLFSWKNHNCARLYLDCQFIGHQSSWKHCHLW